MPLARLLLRLLGRRLPVSRGELRVPGPVGRVTVRRDKHGVAYVDADTDADAYFGLGFCHGQDRAAQLEILQRVGRGTLSEWVGVGGLGADRLSRRIGFRRAAEAQVLALDADVRGYLTAYASGVTAGATLGLTRKPHEFAIVGGTPTPWDAADVLAYTKLQSFGLASNYDVELARLRLVNAAGPAAAAALDPLGDLAAFRTFFPVGGGSNNWVISGERTVSGKPLLANDPHLPAGVPNPWYLAQVRTPEWAVCGASFAGCPVFPCGHNGFAAWGVTAGLTDNTDLFLEVDPPTESIREVIRVKGGADVIEDVAVTPRGPVITPLVAGLAERLSLRAVWLDPLPLRGFLDAPRAKSFDAFRKPFAAWPTLPLSIVYADETGTTGWQLVGQLPVRTAGDGTFPLPPGGWERDLVPFEQMPYAVNPPAGFVGTANGHPRLAAPWANPSGVHLGEDFLDEYRGRAIRDALAAKADWDLPACQRLHTDTRCVPWDDMRESILALAPADPDAQLGLKLLREWDGQLAADSPAAAVYELFVSDVILRVAKAKAPAGWEHAVGGAGPGKFGHNLFAERRHSHLVNLLLSRPPGWFPDWDAELTDALAGVVRTLRTRHGPGPAYWGWGHLRMLELPHPLFDGKPVLGSAFGLPPIPYGGDSNTIAQAGWTPLRPLAAPSFIPNLRAVIDTSDFAKSRFGLAGGQSGNPCSPHFADLFPMWQAGDGVPIAWHPADVLRTSVSAVRLVGAGV